MSYRLPTVGSSVITSSSGTGSENIQSTTGTLSPVFDGGAILLFWSIAWLATATALSGTFFLRRGTTTAAPLVFTSAVVTVASGQTVRGSGMFIDTPPPSGPLQYSLSCVNNTAGAAASLSEQSLFAVAL